MKLTAIPKSRAKTAYSLLSEIRALIIAEPKRYNQRDTLAILGGPNDDHYATDDYPACGTIGCVAGWAVALKAQRPNRVIEVLPYAQRLLGLDAAQNYELFNSFAAAGESRTPDHANAGAAHIAAFQAKYRRQLLATKV